ncbi:MAG: alpha,2-mannosidase [Chloroflexi bacterium]|nr:alpha,2-mannosidase [Chloroflexota bacterium]
MALCRRVLLSFLLLVCLPASAAFPATAKGKGHHVAVRDLPLVQYVNPLIGTETSSPGFDFGNDGGHVFPGAAYPHGMVQWSPDSTNAAGGYRYGQTVVNGFSLTHFSGRGCSAYQDFPFMPIVSQVNASPANMSTYGTSFSHTNETAMPGYYSMLLGNGVKTALTVTPRTGMGSFTYPAGATATMLINAGGSATGNNGSGTGIQIVGSNEVTGSASSGNFCGTNSYRVYIAATFDHPFSGFGTWQGGQVSAGSRTSSGSQAGAFLTFDTKNVATVQVKVGISFVSIANARANLQRENRSWDFNAARAAASAAWNAKLNQIQVTGGTRDERTIFYTALYHTLFHPNVFSDVNGQYIGFDGQIHSAKGYTQYENFPGWDMHRSLIRLRALLEPAETSDMLQSLVADAQQGGGGLPRWQVANDNSGGMIGDSQDIVIATGYAFGARHFDTHGALQAMDAGASRPGTLSGRNQVREGLDSYLSKGYVSQATGGGSAAITLEYASDDFAISQFAQALGDTAKYRLYLQRAQNWRNLFNPATGYIEPRNPDGSYIANFNPTSQDGFRESDGAQYTWMVPFNLRGLFDAMGGNAKVIQRLDNHFSELNAGPNSPYAFMGNEPGFGVPWVYDFAGAPYRTQDVVRRIELQLFHATPGGLVGNDDGGALSSWYVFAAMGLYPEIPGVAGFAVGSPLFSNVTVRLAHGQLLRITGDGAADNAPYIQRLRLNGRPYNSPWIPFASVAGGGTVQFTLGSSPNTTWGSDPSQAPPSFAYPPAVK